MLSVLFIIGIVFFMIINLTIYHKIFHVFYFDLTRGLFKELFFAWFIAMLEMGVIMRFGKAFLGGIVKIILFVGAILLLVVIISKIVQLIKAKKDTENTDNVLNDFITNNQEMVKKAESDNMPMDVKPVADNANIEGIEKKVDIELVEVGSNKIKVIKVIREMMNMDLGVTKNFVESSEKILKEVDEKKAENIKAKLEEVGAKVILRSSTKPGVILEKEKNVNLITCVSCGKMIDENAKFCNFCGAKMVKRDMNVCIKCGKPISLNANFCDYCGEKQERI